MQIFRGSTVSSNDQGKRSFANFNFETFYNSAYFREKVDTLNAEVDFENKLELRRKWCKFPPKLHPSCILGRGRNTNYKLHNFIWMPRCLNLEYKEAQQDNAAQRRRWWGWQFTKSDRNRIFRVVLWKSYTKGNLDFSLKMATHFQWIFLSRCLK